MLRARQFTQCRFTKAVMVLIGMSCSICACGGSVSAGAEAKASGDADGQGDVNFDAEGSAQADAGWETTEYSLNEQQTNAGATPSTPQGVGSMTAPALFGARHDVSLAANAKAQCKCLAVVLGEPNSSEFVWKGQRPSINTQTQRVIGLSSNGIDCPESNVGASYMGYEVVGGDTIVKIEGAAEGHPIPQGAIIPRPPEGKQVYIQPVENLPYGQGRAGEARCAVGR